MLEELKTEVCAIAKKAQNEGLCRHKSGNFSALDPESGLIAITPSGIDRDTLTPDGIVLINRNAQVIENPLGYKPTSESLMHLAIYENRPDIRAVAHSHPIYATSFAILGKPIPAVTYEGFTMGLTKARIPVAPYARPGTPELAQSVVEPCQEANCLLLARHGAVAFSPNDIEEAYLTVAYVEEMAHLYYNALMLTGGVEPPVFKQEELSSWKYPSQIKGDSGDGIGG
jgi:L-fuculose-phosphate aldolase